MPSEARVCAHAVLRRVFEQGAYADRAFHSCASALSPRDRALAMRLSYGAIQRARTLDHVAERLTGRPSRKLDPVVRTALRIGLYELAESSRTPAHAIVDDAVELAKRGGSAGHGLVNATLRRAARERERLLAGLDDSTPQAAAVAHSQPHWLAEMWWRQLGPERARSLMAACNEPAESAIRVNTLRADPAEIAARLPARPGEPVLGVQLPEALVLDGRFDLLASAEWRAGEVLAQSRAAMLVARVLAPARGERVLDLCAAPGGKSTHLAALMGGGGEVLAVERDPVRARLLGETVARLGASSVSVIEADAERLSDDVLGGGFHRVLLDPPCSGLGTLQSHPDLRWRMTPERIGQLVAIQARMLASAARAVGAGGTLVYSTCTISEAENEQQIEAFLASHPDFVVRPATGGGRFLTTLLSEHGTAGFFVAALERS
ncbi:MAG: 16S rRNA (cytosine(967)-C(5))-methyltransferase RsmB [Solirubrobacteraceae bacterium]